MARLDKRNIWKKKGASDGEQGRKGTVASEQEQSMVCGPGINPTTIPLDSPTLHRLSH